MAERLNTPYTNEHFAAWCLKMVGQPYWYGCVVYKCTESRLKSKAAQYPSHYTSGRMARYRADIAAKKVAADCVGGVKGYMWTNGGQGVLESIGTDKSYTNNYASNGCPDKSANGMFEWAKSKGAQWGKIGTLPEIVGLALRMDGHIGYYIGGGWAVEWRGFNYGCVKTKVSARPWTHWYKLPFIDYNDAAEVVPEPVRELGDRDLYKGLEGEDVAELQTALISLGYSCGSYGADGEFGSATEAAVCAFQTQQWIDVDGIAGTQTITKLREALVASEVPEDVEPEEQAANEDAVPITGAVEVTGGSVWLWNGHPDAGGEKSVIVHQGDVLTPLKEGVYVPIVHNGTVKWINQKYLKEN